MNAASHVVFSLTTGNRPSTLFPHVYKFLQTWAAMKIVTNWCCGSKRPVSTMLALETALGLNSTEAVQIRLANEALL